MGTATSHTQANLPGGVIWVRLYSLVGATSGVQRLPVHGTARVDGLRLAVQRQQQHLVGRGRGVEHLEWFVVFQPR